MRSLSSVTTRLWILVPLLALGFAVWCHQGRMRHLAFASGVDREAPAFDAASPTGYAGGTRTLIVPAHNSESYDWIVQTQEMVHRHEARIHRADYDNAPLGREARSPSPYRWLLGGLACLDHAVSGRPLAAAVERAAVYADPLLHVLLLLAAAGFAAWRFGWLPAALLALGVAALFPFAAGFIPGAPDSASMSQLTGLASMLLLLAGYHRLGEAQRENASATSAHRWFFGAGIMGGAGLWLDPLSQTAILGGIGLGALLALVVVKQTSSAAAWRAWGAGGAATVVVAWLVEYAPDQLADWRVDRIHPLYAVSWLGLAWILAGLSAWRQHPDRKGKFQFAALLGLATLAAAVLPFLWWRGDMALLGPDRFDLRLTKLPDAGVAASSLAWIRESGGTAQIWATLLPLALLGPIGWLLFRPATGDFRRGFLLVAFGPLLVAGLMAFHYLHWWQTFDGLLLVALATAGCAFGPEAKSGGRWGWLAAAVLFLPGASQLLPPPVRAAQEKIPIQEVDAMVERDLARWLAKRTADKPGTVVWAPPATTQTLYYYGGLRGLGTFARENLEGLTAAVRLARATSLPEAQALVRRRGITHLVLPSWDPYFDELVRRPAGDNAPGTFMETLYRWELPPWLKPVPYQFPRLAGIEDYAVVVLEVVDDQEESVALSRRAEYFAEMGLLNSATVTADELQRFPTDVGALTAQAQVRAATGDAAKLARVVALLKTRVAGGADRYLPWDRRVSLALVLVRENELERAREQVRRCVAEMNAERLRQLSPGMLFNLQVLIVGFELEIADPALRALARDLLPLELRHRL